MKDKVESYVDLLSMRDSGVKLNFDEISDEQMIHFCLEEDLIDAEIAFLYNTSPDSVRKRRHQAYLNQIHILQEKVLQEHFVVMEKSEKKMDDIGIKSDNVRGLIQEIHKLSNSELDELLDYLIINNKRLSSTIIRPGKV
ncbi:hypothetical protein [Gudongella sp. SC589]|uniref:hypothetical protein n=1 Tax=Gudongella sp. SC589 TaxID=3385990 RepID=UPI003904A790